MCLYVRVCERGAPCVCMPHCLTLRVGMELHSSFKHRVSTEYVQYVSRTTEDARTFSTHTLDDTHPTRHTLLTLRNSSPSLQLHNQHNPLPTTYRHALHVMLAAVKAPETIKWTTKVRKLNGRHFVITHVISGPAHLYIG